MTKKNFFAAAALVALASSAAVAQTDFGSPLGGGAGIGASVAPLGVPANRLAVGGGAAPSARVQALSGRFSSSPAGGVSVQNPAGGSVMLPQGAARALGALLSGSPSTQAASDFSAALGGGSGAARLTSALQTMGSSPTLANIQAAVSAYNDAVRALPAGQSPTPALLAARAAIGGAMGM